MGASGYIGRHVLAELHARGHHIAALVRPDSKRPEAPAECEFIDADVARIESLQAALLGRCFDVVVSCIASRTGTAKDSWAVDYQANLHLLQVATVLGVGHFVLLSAICVQKPRLAFQHAKLKFEAALADSGVGYSIVRPTAFVKSITGQIQRIRDGRPYLVFGDGELTACKPISQIDLARFMVDCVEQPDQHQGILPIGGPGPALTPMQHGELLFRLLQQEPCYRHVPPGLFKVMSSLLSPFTFLSNNLDETAEFLRIGHYYATESMLLWDANHDVYDAQGTPEYGEQTIEDMFIQALNDNSRVDTAVKRLF